MAQGAEDAEERPVKKRRTESPRHHKIRHVQQTPDYIEPASQDTLFVQTQLLRSIGTALAAVGYDSVKPSALEAFRAETEEYMLHFLSHVRESMLSARRIQPIPQDFSIALTSCHLAPSLLQPHIELDIPSAISNPTILAPAPAEPDPPDLSIMLGTELAGKTQTSRDYIPAHFPSLPSIHAWQSTPVFTERERDPRKIRERATQEGMLAEQALRRLTSANKPRSPLEKTAADKNREQLWQDTLAEVLGDSSMEVDADGDLALDSFGDGKSQDKSKMAESINLLRAGEGMVVNHERSNWRRGAPLGAVRM